MDLVISTAAIPGKRAPVLITEAMVASMKPGSVIVDVAADIGGNCALTRAGETVVTSNGVTVLGPVNLPATMPLHASQMLSRNILALLQHLIGKEGHLVKPGGAPRQGFADFRHAHHQRRPREDDRGDEAQPSRPASPGLRTSCSMHRANGCCSGREAEPAEADDGGQAGLEGLGLGACLPAVAFGEGGGLGRVQ